MSQHDRYISPFSTRYASDEMQYIFSDDNKFRTWRKLWIALGDKAHGSVTVDDGAAKALVSRGSSLLAVGIREVDGQFAEGDVLDVCDPSGMVVARGIAEADSDVLELAAGRRQDQIASNRLLADLAEKPAIHRDNLIVFA